MSLHIAARDGEIADRILLPGDPLRAKYIAETFLDDAVCYTDIRNILGYTGTYKGVRLSVQGTGMGIPSISIYATELMRDYGVKKLIRVGTCGAMRKDIKLRDVIIAQGATTDSSIIRNIFGGSINYWLISRSCARPTNSRSNRASRRGSATSSLSTASTMTKSTMIN